MPQLRLLLCCLALLFLAAPAMAEEDELAPGFDRCMEQSGGVTMEMMGCFQQAYDYWDARLNANYQKARQACQNSSDPKGWSANCSRVSEPGSNTRNFLPIWCSCPTKAAAWPV